MSKRYDLPWHWHLKHWLWDEEAGWARGIYIFFYSTVITTPRVDHNHLVLGSNPSPATRLSQRCFRY